MTDKTSEDIVERLGAACVGGEPKPTWLYTLLRDAKAVILASQDEQDSRIREFTSKILHGDADHRTWLNEAADAFIADKPMPKPTGMGRLEAAQANITELKKQASSLRTRTTELEESLILRDTKLEEQRRANKRLSDERDEAQRQLRVSEESREFWLKAAEEQNELNKAAQADNATLRGALRITTDTLEHHNKQHELDGLAKAFYHSINVAREALSTDHPGQPLLAVVAAAVEETEAEDVADGLDELASAFEEDAKSALARLADAKQARRAAVASHTQNGTSPERTNETEKG